MNEKQEYVSNTWIQRAKEIHTSSDKFNLTALRGGTVKHDAEVDFLKKTGYITNNTTLLDLACGNGRLCDAFSDIAKTVTGTDLCEDFITYLNDYKIQKKARHMNFFKLDLLDKEYSCLINSSFSVILLFGVTQLIIDDTDLLNILKNTKKILSPNGRLLIKQTTSIVDDDISIDHISQDLQQRWIAKYRNSTNISKICSSAGLEIVSFKSIYNKENLGEAYGLIEKWHDTRQVIFDVVHGT